MLRRSSMFFLRNIKRSKGWKPLESMFVREGSDDVQLTNVNRLPQIINNIKTSNNEEKKLLVIDLELILQNQFSQNLLLQCNSDMLFLTHRDYKTNKDYIFSIMKNFYMSQASKLLNEKYEYKINNYGYKFEKGIGFCNGDKNYGLNKYLDFISYKPQKLIYLDPNIFVTDGAYVFEDQGIDTLHIYKDIKNRLRRNR